MESLETLVKTIAEHPRRRTIVTLLTLVTLVMVMWPAADEYLALCDFRAHLMQSLDEARAEAEALPQLEKLAQQRATELAAFEQRTVDEGETFRFREELVELVRQSGCQMRRIDVDQPQRRRWQSGEDPLAAAAPAPNKQDPGPSPYELSTRRLTLAVSGPLSSVHALFDNLRALDKVLCLGNLHEQPEGPERKEIAVDIELIVLSLEKPAVAAGA
ncbi:MAG: hypothetical protein K1X74_17085 [Pirellulales bacterium]|nr:hypothetical protein [Pirellulales bacterium]